MAACVDHAKAMALLCVGIVGDGLHAARYGPLWVDAIQVVVFDFNSMFSVSNGVVWSVKLWVMRSYERFQSI